MCMVVQKDRPGLRGELHAFLAHMLLNSALGDVYVQLEEFSLDALGTPQAIVAGHDFDQRDHLGSDFGVPASSLGSSLPELAEGLTMPAEMGIGLNNEQCLCPTAGSSCEQYQEQPIDPGTRWTLDLTVEDDQLLTEQRVLGDEACPGAGQIVQSAHEEGVTRWPRPLHYILLDATRRLVPF